jgi:hypothetical protein
MGEHAGIEYGGVDCRRRSGGRALLGTGRGSEQQGDAG